MYVTFAMIIYSFSLFFPRPYSILKIGKTKTKIKKEGIWRER